MLICLHKLLLFSLLSKLAQNRSLHKTRALSISMDCMFCWPFLLLLLFSSTSPSLTRLLPGNFPLLLLFSPNLHAKKAQRQASHKSNQQKGLSHEAPPLVSFWQGCYVVRGALNEPERRKQEASLSGLGRKGGERKKFIIVSATKCLFLICVLVVATFSAISCCGVCVRRRRRRRVLSKKLPCVCVGVCARSLIYGMMMMTERGRGLGRKKEVASDPFRFCFSV